MLPVPRPGLDVVLLDAGPLLTHLALHYLQKTGAEKARRDAVLRDVRPDSEVPFAETEQERLGILLDRFKRLLTTPHVVAEVLKLRGYSMLFRDEMQFRKLSLELLTSERMEEVPCPLREVCADPDCRDLICRLGLSDAGLIYVATREKCLLLTDDRRMFGAYTSGAEFEIRLLDDCLRPAE
jgi:hypothetical protein